MKIIRPASINKTDIVSTTAEDELLPQWEVEGVQFPQNFPGQTVDYRGDTIAYHNDRRVFVYSRAQNQSRLVAEVTGNAPNETLVLYGTNGVGDSSSLNTNGAASEFRQVRLSPDELSIALVLSSGIMVVVGLQNGTIDFNLGAVDSVEFSESGTYLATMGSRFRVINASTFVVEQQALSTFATSSHIAFSSDETRCMAVGVSNFDPNTSPYSFYTLNISNGNFNRQDLIAQATDLISRPGFNEVTVTYVNRAETRIPGGSGVDSFLPFITDGSVAGIYSADGQTLYLLGISPKNRLFAADRVNETVQTVTVNSYDVGSSSKRANIALSSGELALTDIDQGFQFITESTLTAPPGSVNPQYQIGEQAIFQDEVYEAVQQTQLRPDIGAQNGEWLNLGAVNSLRMFDGKLDSLTSGPDELVIELRVNTLVNGLALFNVTAQTIQVEVVDDSDGTVYDTGPVVMIDNSTVNDWYSFFYEPYTPKKDIAFVDLPPYPGALIRVTVSGPGQEVSIGQLVLGTIMNIGRTQYGTSVGIIDFSRKEQDQFGNFNIVPRRFSKRAEYDVKIDTNAVAGAQRTLANFRTTPVVWIGKEEQEETIVYGFFRDFDITISNFSLSDATITVEGL